MTDLDDLIARLEAATEGSDELDREIATACGIAWSPDEDGNFGGYNILPRRCKFSRSLDAALTLVPEGWEWFIGGATFKHTDGSGEAQLFGHESEERKDEAYLIVAKAPALALCIAALKARRT